MLNHIKVLSFTHFLQGPSAVQMLADLGADVTKIESPTGAFERHWSGLDAFINDVSVFFLLGNRNQKSMSINLRSEEGKEVIYRMIEDADVVVENFRPGVMDRLGFGYEKLSAINPRLVYCSCTGYGSDGPYLNKPGQDLLLQAMSGLASITGNKEAPPTPVGTAAVDQHGAVLAAFGISAALLEREKTGKGRKIESNLLNAALDLQIEPLTYYLNKGDLLEKSDLGSRFHQAPYGIYQTADGWIAISLTPIQKMAEAFHSSELAAYTEEDKMLKREEVNDAICRELKKYKTDEVYELFDKHGIWHAPVNEYKDVENDPQVKWNKMINTIEHPDAGTIKLLSHPIRYDSQVPDIRSYPPRLGEHTRDVLLNHGYTDKQIEDLLESEVVFQHTANLKSSI